MKAKKTLLTLLTLSLLFAGSLVYGASYKPSNFWKTDGSALNPLVSTWDIGSSSLRIPNIYATNVNTNTITINTASEGALVIDVTDPEAFLVRKNSDGGDLFILDTTNFNAELYGGITFSSNTATSTIITIDQNYNHKSIDIDSEATSATAIDVDTQNTSGNLLEFSVNSVEKAKIDYTGKMTLADDLVITGDDLFMGTNTTGYILRADGTNYNPVSFVNSSDLAGFLSDESGSGVVIYGTTPTFTTSVNMGTSTSKTDVTFHDAGTIVFNDDGDDMSVTFGPVANGTTTLGITGGLSIDENNDYVGLKIDSEATTAGKYALQSNGKFAGYFNQDVADGYGLYVYRNLQEVGSLPVVSFINDHVSSTQAVLALQDDGSGGHITTLGTNEDLELSPNGSGNVVVNGDTYIDGNVTSTAAIVSSGNDLGWSVVSGANTACTTTCTNAAVFGLDIDAAVLVGPTDAAADYCVCAGAN